MAGLTSVSGLVSGLDTASIISQLMQIEAQSQNRIKSQLATAQSDLKSLQDLNSKFAALATSAGTLADPASWNPITVTSSSTLVTATAGSSAVAGPLTFSVGHTALAHQLSFTSTAMTTRAATGSSCEVDMGWFEVRRRFASIPPNARGETKLCYPVGSLNAKIHPSEVRT